MQYWRDDAQRVQDFFMRFGVSISDEYSGILSVGYDKSQVAVYLIAKIEKAIAICDFLDSLASENNEDVDKIKIFHLISHAEIAMNTFSKNGSGAELIDQFFKPVDDKLQYTLRLVFNPKVMKKLSDLNHNISASRVLYKMRCEYAHQGNFTGKVFLPDESKSKDGDWYSFCFDWDIRGQCPMQVSAQTKLTYTEFLTIYFSALKHHFEIWSSSNRFLIPELKDKKELEIFLEIKCASCFKKFEICDKERNHLCFCSNECRAQGRRFSDEKSMRARMVRVTWHAKNREKVRGAALKSYHKHKKLNGQPVGRPKKVVDTSD